VGAVTQRASDPATPAAAGPGRAPADVLVGRQTLPGAHPVEVAFTHVGLDLGDRADAGTRAAGLAAVAAATGATPRIMRQVHGARVVTVTASADKSPPHAPSLDTSSFDSSSFDSSSFDSGPEADGLVTAEPGVALLTRAADCVPVLLADPDAGVVGAAHAGRPGVVAGVVPATIAAMRELGAGTAPGSITAWVGPHVCGRCYEVPEEMRAEVSALVPEAWATTSWDTPSLDLGAGVVAQLRTAGCSVRVFGGCTREEPRWPSYRRDGMAAGRFAGLVWRRA
jgi:purine-nucleoside/S-methyl-5'-thioadenosine phosphorylase / adenosine deaminase